MAPTPQKTDNRFGHPETEVRRLDAELRLSEARYASVVEHIGLGVAIISRDMRILTLNRQMRQWFPGVSAVLRPVCYRAFRDPPGEEICPGCPTHLAFMDGQVHESVTQTPSVGGMRRFKVVASPLRDSLGRLTSVIEIVEDVTDILRFQQELKASEERYRAIAANSKNGVVLYEAADGGADFIIRDFNEAAGKIEDLTRAEVIGRRVLEVFPGIRDFGLLAVMQRVWRTGDPEHQSASFYEDDRISGWRENFIYKIPSGEIVTVYTDESRRKQAEEKIRQRESELQAKSLHLEDVNAALRVLLDQRQKDRKEIEQTVAANVRELVLPYLQQLKTRNLGAREAGLLETIAANLDSIVSPFIRNINQNAMGLSPMELRVADQVRAGNTNQQIADLMGVSVNTILTHRFKIRKKLGLKNRKINLVTYLRAMGKNSDPVSLIHP